MSIDQNHPIIVSAKKFAHQLSQLEEVHRFRLAEEQINQSERVQNLISEIKRKQKESVHAKHYEKKEYFFLLEEELKKMNEKLEKIPIVREYQQSQVEINEVLQMTQKALSDAISQVLEIEISQEILGGGCGSGGSCGC